jgi:Skp family chaperone for outer membrane proteins
VIALSLKSVEMQVAIPRAYDASKVQDQLHQKPAHQQAELANLTKKEMEDRRKKSTEVSESSYLESSERESEQFIHEKDRRNAKNKQQNSQQQADHPYKGRHIDISF